MKVEIKELRLACESVLSHLEEMGIHSCDIQYDYYWNIPKEVRYNVDNKPDVDQFDLGQLSDDLDSIRLINTGDAPPLSYAMVWLAHIFQVIGEAVVK